MSEPASRRSDRAAAVKRIEASTRAILRARERKVVSAARAANGAFADPAEAVLEAIVALVEARATWEERHMRALAALDAHESAAQAVEAPVLPRPYVGPWLLDEHAGIKDALTNPRLTTKQIEALPGHIETFIENWVRRIEVVRHRRDPARSRLAAAS